jgi:hypothetical protein
LLELTEKHETLCPVQWTPTAAVGALRSALAAIGPEQASVDMDDVTDIAYAERCGAFKTHIVNGTAHYRPSQVLNDAYANSERRVKPEGGWIFGRMKSAGDISGICAATLAVGGVDKYGFSPGVWSL